MRTLEKIDLNKFKAVSLSDAQNESIIGGTHIRTCETGGLDGGVTCKGLKIVDYTVGDPIDDTP